MKKTSVKSSRANFETASRIIAHICENFDVTPAQLESPSRAWQFTYPRWLAINLIRCKTSYSVASIGVLFNRDNGSILHAIGGLTDEITTNPRAKRDWDNLLSVFSDRI